MKEQPIAKAFMLIEPGPVTLVTTAVGRKKNIMTISWTLVMDFTPKLAFVTGAWNHSFQALMSITHMPNLARIPGVHCGF